MRSHSLRYHFEKINEALKIYYRTLDREYKNEFLNYVENNELIDPEIPIQQELGDAGDPNDYAYNGAWNNHNPFPISPDISISEAEKDAFIFYILQYCYKHHMPPSLSVIKQSILPKIGASDSEPTEDRWSEVSFLMRKKCDEIKISKIYIEEVIGFCRVQTLNVTNLNINKVQKQINSDAFVATKEQKDSISKLLEESVNCVCELIRDNVKPMKSSDIEYKQRCNDCEYFLQIIQAMCKIYGDDTKYDDKQLLEIFMKMGSDDILLINDVITRIECDGINYDIQNITNDASFTKLCNEFIMYRIPHYEIDGKLFTKFVQTMDVIRRSRFLNVTSNLQRIQRINNDSLIKINTDSDDDDDDEIKTESKMDYNDDVINCNFSIVQKCIYLLTPLFLKYASEKPLKYTSEKPTTTYFSIVCDILSFNKCNPQELDDIINYNNIFQHSAFDENTKQGNMAYIFLDAKTKKICVRYYSINEQHIGVVLSKKQYKHTFAHSDWFHVVRGARSCFKTFGFGIYKLGNKIKMYIHDYGSTIPLTLKDACCSKWLQLRFHLDSNAVDESYWYKAIHPYLQQIFQDIKSINLLNHYLDNKLYSTYCQFVDRLVDYNCDVFQNFRNELNRDIIQNKTSKLKVFKYESKYGCNIDYKIAKHVINELFNIIKEPFYDETMLEGYIENVITMKINKNELIIVQNNKQEEALVSLELCDEGSNEPLCGHFSVLALEWLLDDYFTRMQISDLYPFIPSKLFNFRIPLKNKDNYLVQKQLQMCNQLSTIKNSTISLKFKGYCARLQTLKVISLESMFDSVKWKIIVNGFNRRHFKSVIVDEIVHFIVHYVWKKKYDIFDAYYLNSNDKILWSSKKSKTNSKTLMSLENKCFWKIEVGCNNNTGMYNWLLVIDNIRQNKWYKIFVGIKNVCNMQNKKHYLTEIDCKFNYKVEVSLDMSKLRLHFRVRNENNIYISNTTNNEYCNPLMVEKGIYEAIVGIRQMDSTIKMLLDITSWNNIL
eukprot:7951_1